MSVFEPMNFTMHPDSSRSDNALVIPPNQRNMTTGNYSREFLLPEGVNRVMFEWQGVKTIYIRLRAPDSVNSNIIRILNAGESAFMTVPTRAEGYVIWASGNSEESDNQYHLAVTVIPGPPVGAGGGKPSQLHLIWVVAA
ncbi:hypothetical protein YH66_09545 [[Brevibacterium] flavum]|uniref:Uncharacterized protein n=1 Tax=[Brevibacterium] flavum TaxID=92706 RepID=A0A0F6Z631_9CORY|nr:hypothetical protein YH66_09545 [[Brevibacterium] flavum]KEI23528.1 hypothetical protein KIQ_013450 [Corynebacterium glutamicum ATCC 14067]OKX96002.1 hypothetical protein AUP71_01565 [Corynebacterium glutamicum]